MKFTVLGSTGLAVSRLAFGAMTFGNGAGFPTFDNGLDQKAADALVGQAIDAGINLFDTANVYTDGQSEELLGRALGTRRRDVILSTKVGGRAGGALADAGLSRRHIVMAAEDSLRRMGTDWIDIYHLHVPDPIAPMDETLRALEDLVRAGKVRYVGLSNFSAGTTALGWAEQKRLGFTPFSVAQMFYSLLGRDIEHECVPVYRHANIGVLAYSPLAAGFLSGKFTRQSPAPEDARRTKFSFPPIDIDKGYDVVDILNKTAGRLETSPAAVALAWILTRPFISSVILGATRADQLRDNLAAADLDLDKATIDRLDDLTRPPTLYPGWMGPAGFDAQVREALPDVTV